MTTMSELIDRMDIIELVGRYMVSLDERNIDDAWARRFHTADVAMEAPVGEAAGLDGLAESTRVALERFERTQHLASNHIVDLDGDRAAVRWDALMVHVHLASTAAARGEEPGAHFDVGGRFDAEAVRTADGWRFRRMAVRPVWFDGRPPIGME
ncbi:nuclear transport factor 2 family protein [Actinomadura rifamycini]|uniref:nuclear transport factor 2 family protein n=1 Tax=Actinomadura rifamycini TaxID=31962 RepID=UPI000555A150|nr:nuclear transport factor 2 family protein [Actinomadura rifamycini]